MENILMYSSKVSISLAILYILYKALFARDTFFVLRRTYILLTIIFSLLIPFIEIGLSPQAGNYSVFSALTQPLIIIANNTNAEIPDASQYNIIATLLLLSIVGTIFFLVRMLLYLRTVVVLYNKNYVEKKDGYYLININDKKFSSFSFFNLIFLNSFCDVLSKESILIHESVHVRQYHSIDVVLMEIYLSLFWWNPFVWLLKNEMRINHEFLADKGVLDHGCYKKDYQYTLLNLSSENTSISIINFFNVSQLTKRIAMMNKKRTSLFSTAKYLMIIPVLGLLIVCTNLNAVSSGLSKNKEISLVNDPIPESISKELNKTLALNMKYPAEARNKNISGIVSVSFVISKDGKISDIKIIDTVDKELGAEVLRVMDLVPQFENFKQASSSTHEIKVLFKLVGDEEVSNNENADLVVVGYL